MAVRMFACPHCGAHFRYNIIRPGAVRCGNCKRPFSVR